MRRNAPQRGPVSASAKRLINDTRLPCGDRSNLRPPAPMALLQKNPIILPRSQERRRFQRVQVNLLGRYMLADRRELPCQVHNMSPGGMALIAPVAGAVGERIIAYVDHLGRLE